MADPDQGGQEPDFAFVEDCYVHNDLLKKHQISEDCEVVATAIFTGDKWKVIELSKI